MLHDKDENGVMGSVRQENLKAVRLTSEGEKDECVLLTRHVGSM